MKVYDNKDGSHINKLILTFLDTFCDQLIEEGKTEVKPKNRKNNKMCLWCGAPLINSEASFCSVYCANLWGGEGD
jgi:hypothetical protein